jgi:PAS domain S-box-containing protein
MASITPIVIIGLANHTLLIDRDGRETPIDDSGAPVRSAGGEVHGVVLVFRDITERRAAEAERNLIAGQRQLALDAARLGWWHYDPVTKIASYDKRYTEIFGVTGSRRPNEEILARLHPDDLPGVWAKVEPALNPADPKPYATEFRINHPDGSVRWVEAHGLATFEGEGEKQRAVGFVGTIWSRMRSSSRRPGRGSWWRPRRMAASCGSP